MTKEKILLDTNVWRYIHDANIAADIFSAIRNSRKEILVAPSVLFETARMKDIAVRNGILRLMTDARLKRLMPEAFSVCNELHKEMNRLHPEWTLAKCDMPIYMRNRHDWKRKKGGVWDRFRLTTNAAVDNLMQMEGSSHHEVINEIESVRNQLKGQAVSINSLDIEKFTTRIISDDIHPDYFNKDYPDWRIKAFSHTTLSLLRNGRHPYKDWLKERLSPQVVSFQCAPWIAFFLEEMKLENVPRLWVAGAYEVLQPYQKITSGTACDTQLSHYLIDADIFITADKRLFELSMKIKASSKIQLPIPILIHAGGKGMDALLQLLTKTPSSA
jgi:hypothetical protein